MRKYDMIYCPCPGPDVWHADYINIGLLVDLLGYNYKCVRLAHLYSV